MDKEYVKSLADTLVTYLFPQKIYLFGSCARGEDTEDSDIDLLIVKESNLPRYERIREVQMLIRNRKYPLDLLVYTPSEFEEEKDIVGTIPYEVVQEGVLLYAAVKT